MRNELFVVTCSWCQKIRIDDKFWLEPKLAVGHFKLFEIDLLPPLSHGICDDCLTKELEENHLA